jgi:Neprosin
MRSTLEALADHEPNREHLCDGLASDDPLEGLPLYVYYQGNWWAWFDDQWLGYFPGTEWSNAYTKASLVQWFGEVATSNGVPPMFQMGDGILPPSVRSASMDNLCVVDATAWVCSLRDGQSLLATIPNYYDIKLTGPSETRYGGPGQ